MTEVLLNVYDVKSSESQVTTQTINVINNVTHFMGLGGVFHGAVEIFGEEWSFGYCLNGTGVYPCAPKKNPFYQHRDTLLLGVTDKTPEEVARIVRRLKVEWPGRSYNLLNRNCCHFCEDLCHQLGIGPVPGWLNRFATGVEATINFADKVALSFSTWGTQLHQSSHQSVSWLRNSFKNLRNPALRNEGSSESDRFGEHKRVIDNRVHKMTSNDC